MEHLSYTSMILMGLTLGNVLIVVFGGQECSLLCQLHLHTAETSITHQAVTLVPLSSSSHG